MLDDNILVCYTRNITISENIDSTNNYLKALSQRRDNSVVIAASQNAGRGRRGRTFYSPEGGLYMSLLINKNDIFDSDLITTLVREYNKSRQQAITNELLDIVSGSMN